MIINTRLTGSLVAAVVVLGSGCADPDGQADEVAFDRIESSTPVGPAGIVAVGDMLLASPGSKWSGRSSGRTAVDRRLCVDYH